MTIFDEGLTREELVFQLAGALRDITRNFDHLTKDRAKKALTEFDRAWPNERTDNP